MSKDRQCRLFIPRTASVNLLTEETDPTTPVEYWGDWSAEAVARLAVLCYPRPVRKRTMTESDIETEMRRLMASARAEALPFPMVMDVVIEASIWLKGGETIFQGSRVEVGELLIDELRKCQ